MAGEARRPGIVDQVQVFRAERTPAERGAEMASSPNSEISTFQVKPHSEAPIPVRDSDHILVVLAGTCAVQGPSGEHSLSSGQGFLVPLGVACHVKNSSDEPVSFLSMLTKRSTPYVTNVMSDVSIRIPAEYIDGLGLGSRLYAYVMDRRTIGISPLIMEEWNQASALRMNCKFRMEGAQVVATLPERVVRWYGLDDLADGDYTLKHDRRRSRVRVDLTPLITRRAAQ